MSRLLKKNARAWGSSNGECQVGRGVWVLLCSGASGEGFFYELFNDQQDCATGDGAVG